MLRHSVCCQHNKLIFSKANWYSMALKAILPEKRCVERAIQFQCRRTTATLAATVLDDVQEDAISPMTTKIPPLEPLLKTKIPTGITTVQNKSSVSHFKRCSGHKRRNGRPCTRLVKIDLRQSMDNVYCYDHRQKPQKEKQPTVIKPVVEPVVEPVVKPVVKSVVEPVVKSVVKSVIIDDCWQLWIGDHIEPKSKSLIRQVMKDPFSDRDKAGYIYAFLLEDGPRVSQVEHAYFKIGRAENPHRRMYQVTRSCNFIPKIVEVIPRFPEKTSAAAVVVAQEEQMVMSANEEEALQVDSSEMRNETKCPMSHRVERLIHLELASQYQRAGFKCDECGSTHREWFRVDRRRHPDGTLMTDQELWQSDIRPIVLKWIQFGVAASALKNSD